jgi:hypothetical protein
VACSERKDDFAGRVSTAAYAAWLTLLIAFVIHLVLSMACLVVVHTELIDVVGDIWDTGPGVTRGTFIAFIGLWKLFLMVWLLGCIFLTLWSWRLGGLKAK